VDPVTVPGLRFRWPAGFHELPVRGPAAVGPLLAAVLAPGVDPAPLREHHLALGRLQRQQGIAAAAVCTGRIGDRVTGAYVSLALTPLAYEDAGIAARGIAGTLGGTVHGVRLPAGPAAVSTDVRTVTAGGGELQAGVLQVHLPAPGHQALLVLTLMTPFLEDFVAYCEDGAALATSVRFTDPAPSGLIGAGALR
jgi:hypothetical protein